MARKKTAPERVHARNLLADHLNEIRVQMYGENGGPEFVRILKIPVRTWYNYEMRVTVPAKVLLRRFAKMALRVRGSLTGGLPKRGWGFM
jgi:hypothetical protein